MGDMGDDFRAVKDYRKALTPERLREVLSYDAVTGLFRWRVQISNRSPVGAVAGCEHKRDGRIYIGIDGRSYKAHRLAWLYANGKLPSHGIDHRDGNPANNALDNLRPATQAENMQNLHRAHRDNKSGYLGVQQNRHGKWFARVLRQGVRVDSKPFATPAEAYAAYVEIKSSIHPFSTLQARPLLTDAERQAAVDGEDRASRRTADRIDGYDRDDLGESPDF